MQQTAKIQATLLLLSLWIMNVECEIFFKTGARTSTEINYLRTCKYDKDTRQKFSLEISKYNRTVKLYNVSLLALEPFDSSYKLRINVRKWGDGGWKYNVLNYEKDDACSNLKIVLQTIATNLARAAHVDPNCPIKAGNYHVDYYDADKDSTPYTQSPLIVIPGKFYVLFRVIKNKKVSACVEFEAEIKEMMKY